MSEDHAEKLRAQLRAAEATVRALQAERASWRNGAANSQLAGTSASDMGDQWQAAAKGDVERLRHLTQAGANPDDANYDGRTAMHLAAAEGLLPVLRFLLEEARARRSLADRWGARRSRQRAEMVR